MDVITGAQLNTTNLGVGQSVVPAIKVLSNGETGRFFLYACEVFYETFPEGLTGLPDVESRAATAREAVN